MDFELGQLVKSLAGHDKGQIYVIVNKKEDYIYLADGKLKKLANLKKKNKKHVQRINLKSDIIMKKIINNSVVDADIINVIRNYESNLGG